MANIIKPKRSNTASNVPTTANLSSGELAVNMADKKVYINNGTAVVQVGAGNLTGLGDVTITTPSSGQSLSWNGTAWVNSNAGAGALGTQVIATNGGTTTLTSTSPYYTVFTGTFVQTLVLPDATTLTVGQQYGIDNDGSLAITVKTNGGATLWTIASGCDLYLTLTAQATAVGTWETDYQGAQLATGKTLVVNNSVTVNGTDGTTMTLPTVSGTLATLAGTETLTNKALNGTLGATTPSTVVATTITGTDLTTTGNTILGNASTDTLNVGDGGLIKDASGNVGIGVTPRAWTSASGFRAIDFTYGAVYNANNTMGVTQNAYYNGTNFIYNQTSLASYYYQNGGTHAWHTAPSGTAGNAITFTTAMTLDASSNLTVTGGATIQGLTVGKGGGAVATNTAVGASALAANTTASYNTAVGFQAGYSNVTGASCTFIGYQAGYNSNVTSNIFIGQNTGFSTTSGKENVFLGVSAGSTNITGNQNIYIGSGIGGSEYPAGYFATGSLNTFIGAVSGAKVTTGSKNTILGNYTGNNGGLDIRTASNYIVLSDGDGNPLVSTNSTSSLALNGATPKTGTGITFPATQSASTNANTLDDYEEGTFTPNFTTTGTNFSGGTNTGTGYYVKIGNRVFVQCNPVLSFIQSGGTGDVIMSGLPFTVATGGGGSGTFSSGRIAITTSNYWCIAIDGTTNVSIQYAVTGANATPLPASAVNGQNYPYFGTTITYFTNS